MPTLHVIALTCVRTQETHDQAYLRAVPTSGAATQTDARSMHDGQGIRLDLAVDFGINDQVEVQVWEQDAGRDDELGSFSVSRTWAGMGEWTHDIHRRHAHYVVTFEVTDSHARPTDHEIEIRGLRCIDAQQAHDHVYLMINGESVMDATRMDNGDRRDEMGIRRRFHRNVFVDLWEEDSGGHGSDHLGRMTLLLSEVQAQLPGRSRTHRFTHRSAEGDANYEITYDLSR